MAKFYPTIYASVLCMALIFVHTGESLDCRRPAKEEATSARKLCIQSGSGGCGKAYSSAFLNHQRTCHFQVGRRSGGFATLLEESHSPKSQATEQWRTSEETKFNSLMNRLRAVATEAEEDIPQWLDLEDAEDSLESQPLVPNDTLQRLLARL